MFQSVVSAFVDEIDWLKPRRTMLTAALCCGEFLLGIPCITRVSYLICIICKERDI